MTSPNKLHGSTAVYICPPVDINRFSLLADNGCRVFLNGICVSNTYDLIEHNNRIIEPIFAKIYANKMNTLVVEWLSNMHTDKIQILDWDTKCIVDELYIFNAHIGTPPK
jgi:hypothetical protein